MRAPTAVCLAIFLAALLPGCGQMPLAPREAVPFTFLLTDRDGGAAAGVYVRLHGEGLKGYAEAKTGPDGRARFQVVPDTYEATLDANWASGYPDYVTTPSFAITAKGQEYRYAYGGFLVTGTLTGSDGSAIDSGWVSLDEVVEGGYDGSYISHDFYGGVFRLWVPAGEFRLFAADGKYPSPFPAVRIPSIAIARDTTLALVSSGHLITGHVTGPDGSPQPNAWVYATGDEGFGSTGVTDASGNYRHYLSPGNYRWIVFSETPYRYILPRDFPLAAVTGPATFDFSLAGTSWSGTLRDAGTGAPLPGYAVRVDAVTAYSRSASCETDALGAFRLELQSGWDYDLFVSKQPYRGPYAQFRMPRAGADSTFDLLINPAALSAPRLRELHPPPDAIVDPRVALRARSR